MMMASSIKGVFLFYRPKLDRTCKQRIYRGGVICKSDFCDSTETDRTVFQSDAVIAFTYQKRGRSDAPFLKSPIRDRTVRQCSLSKGQYQASNHILGHRGQLLSRASSSTGSISVSFLEDERFVTHHWRTGLRATTISYYHRGSGTQAVRFRTT